MDTGEEIICSCTSERNKRRSVLLRDVPTSVLMTGWFARPRHSTFPTKQAAALRGWEAATGPQGQDQALDGAPHAPPGITLSFRTHGPLEVLEEVHTKNSLQLCARQSEPAVSVSPPPPMLLLNAVSLIEGNGCAMILIMSQCKTGKTSWAGISFPRPLLTVLINN